MADAPSGTKGIKVNAVGQGCKGITYTIDFLGQPGAWDECFEQHAVPLWLDKRQGLFLVGIELDFVENQRTSGFVFRKT